jgi:hypothetical protein
VIGCSPKLYFGEVGSAVPRTETYAQSKPQGQTQIANTPRKAELDKELMKVLETKLCMDIRSYMREATENMLIRHLGLHVVQNFLTATH